MGLSHGGFLHEGTYLMRDLHYARGLLHARGLLFDIIVVPKQELRFFVLFIAWTKCLLSSLFA